MSSKTNAGFVANEGAAAPVAPVDAPSDCRSVTAAAGGAPGAPGEPPRQDRPASLELLAAAAFAQPFAERSRGAASSDSHVPRRTRDEAFCVDPTEQVADPWARPRAAKRFKQAPKSSVVDRAQNNKLTLEASNAFPLMQENLSKGEFAHSNSPGFKAPCEAGSDYLRRRPDLAAATNNLILTGTGFPNPRQKQELPLLDQGALRYAKEEASTSLPFLAPALAPSGLSEAHRSSTHVVTSAATAQPPGLDVLRPELSLPVSWPQPQQQSEMCANQEINQLKNPVEVKQTSPSLNGDLHMITSHGVSPNAVAKLWPAVAGEDHLLSAAAAAAPPGGTGAHFATGLTNEITLAGHLLEQIDRGQLLRLQHMQDWNLIQHAANAGNAQSATHVSDLQQRLLIDIVTVVPEIAAAVADIMVKALNSKLPFSSAQFERYYSNVLDATLVYLKSIQGLISSAPEADDLLRRVTYCITAIEPYKTNYFGVIAGGNPASGMVAGMTGPGLHLSFDS